MIGRNDPCWCGSGKKWKKCHFPSTGSCLEELPKYFDKLSQYYFRHFGIVLKTEEQIEGIRKSGHLAAHILDETCKMARAGVTGNQLDAFASKLHQEAGAIAAPLHYGEPPFPKSICTSINDVICHGIPDDTPLQEGDIVNIDVTCILNGFFGDCSRMVTIGKTTPERALVTDVSHDALMQSIAILKPGVLISQIGAVIESYAESKGCSVVNQFVGHGVGVQFHEAPQIPHYRNSINIPLVPGMTFTIEPMINAGKPEAVIDPKNGWTARTIDGKASAQWEHTLSITETGCEILTPWKR